MAKPKRRSAAQRDLADREHILYRFWDANDVLLYVGITVDSPTRLANHMRDKPWWREVESIRFTTYANRAEALTAEAEMIRTLKPLYNVVHNEMVEETEGDAVIGEDDDVLRTADLPNLVLAELESGERDYLLREHRTDYDGNARTEDEVALHAAVDAMATLSYDRRRLQRLVRELMGYLPTDGDGYLDVAETALREWCDGGHVSECDIVRVAFEYYVEFRGRQFLGRMSPEAANGWRARVQTLHGKDCADLDRLAAREAKAWYRAGSFDARACSIAEDHGALCARRADARIWYELCLLCASRDRPCEGHQTWCSVHAEEAANAGLRILEQSRLGLFPIARWETVYDLADDPWAVPQ